HRDAEFLASLADGGFKHRVPGANGKDRSAEFMLGKRHQSSVDLQATTGHSEDNEIGCSIERGVQFAGIGAFAADEIELVENFDEKGPVVMFAINNDNTGND